MVIDYIAELLLDNDITLDECVALIRARFPNHVLLVRDFIDAEREACK
jgi:hypothetical protein